MWTPTIKLSSFLVIEPSQCSRVTVPIGKFASSLSPIRTGSAPLPFGCFAPRTAQCLTAPGKTWFIRSHRAHRIKDPRPSFSKFNWLDNAYCKDGVISNMALTPCARSTCTFFIMSFDPQDFPPHIVYSSFLGATGTSTKSAAPMISLMRGSPATLS